MPIALAGLVIAWAVMLLFGAMEFDRGLLFLARAEEGSWPAEIARWVTELGSAVILLPATAAGALWLAWKKEWRSALFLAGLTLSGRLLVTLQKNWTERIRPDPLGHVVPVETLSFPSGHAANATIVWLALALLIPESARGRSLAIWAAVWTALLVGLSRVVLGVHWPSDVIGGWAFGLLWTLLLFGLSERTNLTGTRGHLFHSSREWRR